MKRNPEVSLGAPQATSLSRSISFNPNNINDNFQVVTNRYHVESQNKHNVDKIGVTTIQTPDSLVVRRGIRQVDALTSTQHGTQGTQLMQTTYAANVLCSYLLEIDIKRISSHTVSGINRYR